MPVHTNNIKLNNINIINKDKIFSKPVLIYQLEGNLSFTPSPRSSATNGVDTLLANMSTSSAGTIATLDGGKTFQTIYNDQNINGPYISYAHDRFFLGYTPTSGSRFKVYKDGVDVPTSIGTTGNGRYVSYGNDLYLAGLNNVSNNLFVSSNGSSFTLGSIGGSSVNNMVFCEDRFIYYDGTYFRSTVDGTSSTQLSSSPNTVGMMYVINNDIYITTNTSGNVNNILYVSKDKGVSWTQLLSVPGTEQMFQVLDIGGKLVVMMRQYLLYSSDGGTTFKPYEVDIGTLTLWPMNAMHVMGDKLAIVTTKAIYIANL